MSAFAKLIWVGLPLLIGFGAAGEFGRVSMGHAVNPAAWLGMTVLVGIICGVSAVGGLAFLRRLLRLLGF